MKKLTKRINAMTFTMINAAQKELQDLIMDEFDTPEAKSKAKAMIRNAKRSIQKGGPIPMHLAPAVRCIHLLARCN